MPTSAVLRATEWDLVTEVIDLDSVWVREEGLL